MTETKSQFDGTITMLNLQTKRTLPRDVIKWMQGLDLSYSVKDYRKDLNNGFLIAEIISRYEPGKIPMHAFQNSQNQSRRDNNWNLLQLFFRKHELRKVKIEDGEYNLIMSNNDSKSQQLYEFVCRLFTVCTKRTLPESRPAVDLPPTQSKNPNLTASYLLKQEGLEKLQNSQISNYSNQDVDKVSQDRVPTRKIGPGNDSPARVDVKGVGLKQQINRKVTSKKKSWEMKTQSLYEETNQYVEKYVFDYLNQILEECIPQEQSSSNQIRLLFTNSNERPTQILKKNLSVDKKLLLTFLNEVKSSINSILVAMLKQLNQIWKFFTYFLRMLSFLNQNSEQFDSVLELITTYASSANLNQKKKVLKVFLESLVTVLVSEIKNCTSTMKRDKIMEIIYDFSGRDIQDKKLVLFNLKEKLGSNSPLYISWLAVLIKEQRLETSDEKLVQDFIYYAHQNLNSANYLMRLSALKIMSSVCSNGWINLVYNFFADERNLSKFKSVTQIEQIFFISRIYLGLLKSLIEGHQYQTLIKGKNQSNTNAIKVYNPDHEKQTQQIKFKLQTLALTISKLYYNSNSESVRQIIAKQSTNYINQSLPLMMVVINHLSVTSNDGANTKFDNFFINQEQLYEFKTSKTVVSPANIEQVKQYANEILGELVKFHMLINQNKNNPNLPSNAETDVKMQDQLLLLNFCLDNLNIKKLNMELWSNIADTYLETIIQMLPNSNIQSVNLAWQIVTKIYQIYFNYDMKMEDINLLLANAIKQCSKSEAAQGNILGNIKKFFEEQYKKTNSQEVKATVTQINEILSHKGIETFIALSNRQ